MEKSQQQHQNRRKILTPAKVPLQIQVKNVLDTMKETQTKQTWKMLIMKDMNNIIEDTPSFSYAVSGI